MPNLQALNVRGARKGREVTAFYVCDTASNADWMAGQLRAGTKKAGRSVRVFRREIRAGKAVAVVHVVVVDYPRVQL